MGSQIVYLFVSPEVLNDYIEILLVYYRINREMSIQKMSLYLYSSLVNSATFNTFAFL